MDLENCSEEEIKETRAEFTFIRTRISLYVRDVAQPFLGPLAKLGIVLIFTVFLLVEETDGTR